MSQTAHLFINSSYLILNLIYENVEDALSPDSDKLTELNNTKYFRVGMRLYNEDDYLALETESADSKTALLTLIVLLIFMVMIIYAQKIDQDLLHQGGDGPGDNAIKDHVKGLYPNLIELAYKDRNFGSRQKLSQCIRNFYQGPNARSNW